MTDPQQIRTEAITANGECWRLLEKADRTPGETEDMIAAALESLRLWEQVGTPVNDQRGHWLVARAYVDAGRAGPALQFAGTTLALTERHRDELQDFDLAFAEEIAARAHALAGNREVAVAHYHEAKRLGEAIVKQGERQEFFRQFAIGPWFGMEQAG